jgi:hypothetical protein
MATITVIATTVATGRRPSDSAGGLAVVGVGPDRGGWCGGLGGTPPAPCGQPVAASPPEREGCQAEPPASVWGDGEGMLGGGGGIPGGGADGVESLPDAGPGDAAPGAAVVPHVEWSDTPGSHHCAARSAGGWSPPYGISCGCRGGHDDCRGGADGTDCADADPSFADRVPAGGELTCQ